jgi:hypothetical protein
MVVKNIHGTGHLTCNCESWFKHWENFSHQKADFCAAPGCGNKAEVGAHVVKVNSPDKNHYIIPLCDLCNRRAESFDTDAKLVSANVSETCGR